jgi:hypothetical protein
MRKQQLMAMVIELQADKIDRMYSDGITITRHHQEMDALREIIGNQNNLIGDLQRDVKSLDGIAIKHAQDIMGLKEK